MNENGRQIAGTVAHKPGGRAGGGSETDAEKRERRGRCRLNDG